ncbi:hypothetical protein RRG08_013007 [Elysia crispata]|uniref:MADF domain-containing protein n=1 Tax=Elysia crispata TaxID=231223 RepID=A0AAE1A1F3_9GAST|nr:hypothetical protein RRG08_013007 [Elysia crispata]
MQQSSVKTGQSCFHHVRSLGIKNYGLEPMKYLHSERRNKFSCPYILWAETTFGQVITSLESFRSDDVERFDDQHVEDISDLPVWSHFSCDLRWFSFEQDRVSIGAARWCGWCLSEGKKSASMIEEFRNHECLWDTRSKKYFNKNKRIAALERMSQSQERVCE